MKSKAVLLSCAALAAVTPVVAQDSSAAAQVSGERPTVEAIIVTARRVAENIQDVPISITVFDQEALDNAGITSAADLGNYAPGLIANQKFGADNTTFSMRGFFQELRTTPSVGVYFADVVAPRGPAATPAGDGAGPGDFFDLQSVQILKGPQGTLFGRNTTGGAVLLVPKRPTDVLEGYVEAGYGNYNAQRVQSVLNLPLNDSVRVRFGVDWHERDGYLRNITDVGPRRFANTDYVAARASMLVDITSNLENYTIGTYARSNSRGFVGHMEEAIPTGIVGSVAANQINAEAGNSVYHIANRLSDAGGELETWRFINTTAWNATDSLTVRNIVSYSELRNDVRMAVFGDYWPLQETFTFRNRTGAFQTVPVPPEFQGKLLPINEVASAPGGDMVDQSTFTEELRLEGVAFSGSLNWQAGAYYEESRPGGWSGTLSNARLVCEGDIRDLMCTDVLAILQGVPQGNAGTLAYAQRKSWFENYGVYAQGTLAVNDRISFTGGLRHTWDESHSDFNLYRVTFPASNTTRIFCEDGMPSSGLTFDDARNRIGCAGEAKVKSKAPTWTISAEFRPVDDLMTFVKYSRGYRAGATNPNSLPGFKTFEDEKVDVYEIGLKTSGQLLAGNAYAYLTAYYNDFSDQQVQAGALSLAVPNPNAVILNAGSSRMYGFELEAGIQPFTGLTLNASYSYLDTKLNSLVFPGTPVAPGAPGYPLPFASFDLQSNGPLTGPFVFPTSEPGTDLPLSPNHQLLLSASYAVPAPARLGDISVHAGYSHTSTQVFSFSNYPKAVFDPRDIVNASLSWESIAGSSIDATVFATNLLDERYIVVVNDLSSSGLISRNYGEPRMYGLKVRYKF